MRPSKAVVLILMVCAYVSVLPTPSPADQWNKKTIITFSQPVEIPGKVLPAGTYVFKLYDSLSNRNIVQIFNEDESKVFATIIAVPNYRLTPTGETVIRFEERPQNAPEALKAWFYPGDNYGQEFAYPKSRAIQLARVEQEPVPALRTEMAGEPSPEALKTAPLVAITPQLREQPLAQAIQTTPPATQPAPPLVAQREELPKTASSTPLIALVGFSAVILAFVLKLGRRRVDQEK
jgi:LPXTG-motif cell wall-anchored protein